MVVSGLAETFAPEVVFKPVAGVHEYVNEPLLLEGTATRLAVEPLHIVCGDIAFSVTLGAFTVISTSLLVVAVQEPSVAVATTV